MRDHILIHVNGVPHHVGGRRAFQTLSRFLRDDLRATGTKIVCEEGDCGACTVLIGRRENGAIRYRAVNSCIQFVFQCDLTHVVTVEGLAPRGELHPVQDAMVRCHGAQCGYCTPGFVVAMTAMYESDAKVDAAEVRKALTGNLCRCTGYESIIKAALEVDPKTVRRIEEMYPDVDLGSNDAVLVDLRTESRGPRAEHENGDEPSPLAPRPSPLFFKPIDLKDAIRFRAQNPKAVIVQGGTDFGVWCNKRGFAAEALLSLAGIETLGEIKIEDRILSIGGRVTLTAFEEFVRDLVPELAPILDRFGSPQIKNAGTLAGNIANASPIADTLPFLYVTDARLELTGLGGARVVDIREFYKGYKTLDLTPDEVITRILIPLPAEGETLRLYKVSKRSHLDISSFTAAMLMKRTDGRVDSMRIAYGGVGPMVLRLPKTEAFLAGKPVSMETFAAAGEIAKSEVTPISDVRGSREFRLQLAENILCKFFSEVTS